MVKDTHTYNMSADEELVRACLKTEELAWESFYERFSSVVSGVVHNIVKIYRFQVDSNKIEDCIQNIWLSFFEKDYDKLKKWRKECSLKTYICVCTNHTAINYFKSELTKDSLLPLRGGSIYESQSDNPEDEVAHMEKIEKIRHIINTILKGRDKLLTELYWHDELSYPEISQIMNIPVKNLQTMKHRIQKRILEEYKKTNKNIFTRMDT